MQHDPASRRSLSGSSGLLFLPPSALLSAVPLKRQMHPVKSRDTERLPRWFMLCVCMRGSLCVCVCLVDYHHVRHAGGGSVGCDLA